MPSARLERPTYDGRSAARPRARGRGRARPSGWSARVSAARDGALAAWDTMDRLAGGGLDLKLRRAARKTLGVAAFLAGLVLIGSLMTFHAGDPSWNVATPEPARNAFGGTGAAIADLGLQVFGLAAFALAGPLLAWGVFGAKGRALRAFGLRALLLLPAVALVASGLALFPAPPSWPYLTGAGGAIGDGLLGYLSSFLALGPGIPLSPLVAFACAAGGACLLVYSAGWTWDGVGQVLGRSTRFVAKPVGRAASFGLAKLEAHLDARRAARRDRAEDEDDEIDGDPDPEFGEPYAREPEGPTIRGRLAALWRAYMGDEDDAPEPSRARREPGFERPGLERLRVERPVPAAEADADGSDDGDAPDDDAPPKKLRIEPRVEKIAPAPKPASAPRPRSSPSSTSSPTITSCRPSRCCRSPSR